MIGKLASRQASLLIGAGMASLCVTISLFAGPGEDDDSANDQPAKKSPRVERIPVDEARRRARVLQTTYEASLHTVHRYYFDADERQRIPAKSMEDVFQVVDSETGSQTRWISVSTPAMNVDNEPKTEFEKQAAEILKSGEEEYEKVEEGMYSRAGAITLRAGCLKCHLSALSEEVGKPPVAGLVIRIPVSGE